MICPDCGGEFKNLGAHQRFCSERRPELIVDEYIKEKPLSSIISEVEGVLKSLNHQIRVTVNSDNGVATDVELTARFQLRR